MERSPGTQSMVFAVRTDPASLHRSAKGSITGALFIEIDGRAFPEPAWSDFPVVVLGWWIRAALALQLHAPASCLFMDGPFEWTVSLAGPGAWAITLLERRDAVARVVGSANLDAAAVLAALASAADSVLRACSERSWSSRDVDELRSAREALRQ